VANITIHDVAKLAGVSIKTVSRVINLEPNVREDTRSRVQQAVTELGYRPDKAARNLKSRRSYLIGLIYDDPSHYDIPSSGFIVSLQQGLLEVCKAATYDLLIHPCNYRDANIGEELQTIIEHNRLVGVVVAAPLSNMPVITEAIRSTGTPLIRIAPGGKAGKPYTVATNDRDVSAEMTRYLASMGHKSIGFISGHPKHDAVTNRLRGYKDGLEQAGLRFSEELLAAGDNSFRTGEECAHALLTLKSPPTAIFAANDDMAAGAIRMAHKMGLHVPGQVSIAGFDDVALAQLIYPSLTTIRQPLEAMAARAGEMLITGIKSGDAGKTGEVVEAELVIRESTGPAPV
jgi:LacI family transcriptional regulator